MSNSEVMATPRSQYVDFWNTVLVPKFVRWRHILVGGLTLHSAKVFPSLAVQQGDKVVDAGCGFGDTAIQLARLVGPSGSVVGMDCCDEFLEYGRRDAEAAGLTNITFMEGDVQTYPFKPIMSFAFRGSERNSSKILWQVCAQHAHEPQTRRHHDDDCLARDRR